MLYLNGELAGGETEFNLRSRGSVQSEAGKALVFPHRVLHRSAPVVGGRKYVMRTDILCRWAERGV